MFQTVAVNLALGTRMSHPSGCKAHDVFGNWCIRAIQRGGARLPLDAKTHWITHSCKRCTILELTVQVYVYTDA